jgi:hypothetical protein
MTVYSGELGAINGVAAVRNWTIEDTTDPKTVVSSATRSGTARTPGIGSWSGSASIFGVKPPYMPGETFAFVGYRAPTTGVRNTAGFRSTGFVIIDSIVMTWNWATNDPLSCVMNFSGDGALTHASGAAVLDATTGNVPTPCGTNILIDTVILPDVVSATLTLSKANSAYVSSSTSCATGRVKGAAIDWTLAITQYNQQGLGVTALKADSIITLPANDTEVWDLKWGHMQSVTGVTVDIESAALIQQTLNYAMNGIVSNALGWIKKPGAVTIWPPTP